MQNIGVFFGSRAAEHDVSIISGLQILENADKAKYNVFPVYVSHKGEWFVGEPLKNVPNTMSRYGKRLNSSSANLAACSASS